MNASRAVLLSLASSALLLLHQPPAFADVRVLQPMQALPKPTNPTYTHFGVGVAIDGPHIIVLALKEGVNGAQHTYAALLYRRNSIGSWQFRRTLVSTTGFFSRMDVRMKNGLAIVQFGGQVSLFEYSGGDYVPARVAAPIRHPGGVAISGKSVLIGGDVCEYDAVLYEKGTSGVWGITGRIDDNAGGCEHDGNWVELNYDYALVRPGNGNLATAWRRNGTALDWVPAGVLYITPDTPISLSPDNLQGTTAVYSSGYVFVRSGTGTWTAKGRVRSVDDDNGFHVGGDAAYRDGILITTEGRNPSVRAYVETSPGQFEQLANLQTSDLPFGSDVSGGTVAAVSRNSDASHYDVEIFSLPTPLRAPQPIVNDFEDRDVSDFTLNSGQFALATRGSDAVLAQSSTGSLAIALVTNTDWPDYQRIQADITPTFGAGDSWAGLIVRYVDANNYYFAALRANNAYGIYKRVNGVNTLLREGTYISWIPGDLALVVEGNNIFLTNGSQIFPGGSDNSLTHGRAGIATFQARADFDDVHAAATDTYILYDREWGYYGYPSDVDLTMVGGDWRLLSDEEELNHGLAQVGTSGSALAFIGVPVENQEIVSRVKLDAFGTSQTGAWFGLLARYTDARNYYYVTARSTGQIQIKKLVNGVIATLASANFTPVAGQYYELRFLVINDQLQLFVDQALVASAHDRDIASGQYGLATYRAAVTFDNLSVVQP